MIRANTDAEWLPLYEALGERSPSANYSPCGRNTHERKDIAASARPEQRNRHHACS